ELRADMEIIRRNAEAEAALVDDLLHLVHDWRDLPERPRFEAAAGEGLRKAEAPRKALKILLVEDHADTLNTLTRILSRRGHSVVVAGTVAEGLERGSAERFDLLLSDVGLPDGTGHELVQKLR